MLKKLTIMIFALTMAFAMSLAFTACGGSDQAAEENTDAATETAEQPAGGWQVIEEPSVTALPGEVQTAYDEFVKNSEEEGLIPMAYYGKQITSDTKYGLLCKSTTDNELQTVVLQEDPDMGMIGLMNQFIIEDYTEGGGADLDGEPEDGEWEAASDAIGSTMPEEAKAAYDNARNAYDGTAPQPLTLLGTQVVAGTNYAYLAKGKTDTDNPRDAIQVVTVYEDLEGNAEITNIYTLDIGEYDE